MAARKAFVSPLLHWATEREKIRLAKLAGEPQPWTTDPILQRYRFCNVRRKDDRVSQWLLYNVLRFCDDFDDREVFLLWVALCRWINWPPTLVSILTDNPGDLVTYDQINLPKIGERIDQLVQSDTKAWTGAYMVRAPSKRKYPGFTKGKFVAEVVVGALRERTLELLEAIAQQSAQETWLVLCSIPNWGSFMAGQVVADLTYTPLLDAAYDLNTWAPQGPGSKRGFNRLLGRPLRQKIADQEWSEQLQEWRGDLVGVTGLTDITLHDVQNCLCETDKYLRVKSGEGRPRSVYKPETAF